MRATNAVWMAGLLLASQAIPAWAQPAPPWPASSAMTSPAPPPSPVAPPQAPTVDADATSYCALVTSIAASESALEATPTIFGTGGVVSGADVSPGGSLIGPVARVTAGVSYSASGLLRAMAIRARGAAECRRYRAASELHAFVEGSREGRTRASLAAKLGVLEQALPNAEQILESTRSAVLESRATVEHLGAVELQVDGLRALAETTRQELQALARSPAPPTRPIEDLVRERDRAEAEVERRDGGVRRSRGFDLSVRAGYDRVFGTPFSYSPLFAQATLSVSLGSLLQPEAERRAEAARLALSQRQIEGPDDRVAQALTRLRALRDQERLRREQTRVLLEDLEARQRDLARVPGDRVASYVQTMWFDLIRARADYAYLRAHVADLDALLGEHAP